jgi:protein-S-isoprenylcysteine O-methyltransferase Ste14
MPQTERQAAPVPARWLGRFAQTMSQDFLGGPRPLRLSTVINLQKGGTALFVGALMLAYRNGSIEAWVYLALHGSYGLAWIMKHLAFRDRRFDAPVTVGGAVMTVALVLGPYWLAPWLLVSGVLGPRPEAGAPLLGAAIALHTLGLAAMLGADAQKRFQLEAGPRLLTGGMFARTRNPNYLGEMMVYGAYALLVRHWLPWLVLGWVWGAVFVPNMLLKDASLSRYPGWDAYRAATGLLFPRLAPAPRAAPRPAPAPPA